MAMTTRQANKIFDKNLTKSDIPEPKMNQQGYRPLVADRSPLRLTPQEEMRNFLIISPSY
jgi:hypothetical protein